MDIQTNDISLDIIKESVMVFEEAPHSDTILNNINPIELNNNNPVELNNSNIVESNNIESDISYDYKYPNVKVLFNETCQIKNA